MCSLNAELELDPGFDVKICILSTNLNIIFNFILNFILCFQMFSSILLIFLASTIFFVIARDFEDLWHRNPKAVGLGFSRSLSSQNIRNQRKSECDNKTVTLNPDSAWDGLCLCFCPGVITNHAPFTLQMVIIRMINYMITLPNEDVSSFLSLFCRNKLFIWLGFLSMQQSSFHSSLIPPTSIMYYLELH